MSFMECSIGNVTHTLFAPQVMYVCNGDLVLFQTTTKPYFNDYPLKSFHENKIKKLKKGTEIDSAACKEC